MANNFELGGLFVDAGISRKRQDNRPELQNALSAVTKAKAVLVVYSLSRLARSTKDTIQISERVGTIPFGFRLLDDGRTLVRDEKEQGIIELLELFRESGHSYGKIADILNRKSVRTKKNGAKWQGTTVRNILMAKNST